MSRSEGRKCPWCGRILLPSPITGGIPIHYLNPTAPLDDREWCPAKRWMEP